MERVLRSAIIVEVPEAEPAVSAHRMRLDPHARLGVPAHVTVLYPFAPPSEVDQPMLDRLRELVAGVPAFEHRLVRTDWFREDVLWLAAEDDSGFRTLTGLVSDAFPAYPPYGGQFDEVMPHLTIAAHGPLAEMHAAERAVQPHLPIHSVARHMTLMAEQESGDWTRVTTFRLSAAVEQGQHA